MYKDALDCLTKFEPARVKVRNDYYFMVRDLLDEMRNYMKPGTGKECNEFKIKLITSLTESIDLNQLKTVDDPDSLRLLEEKASALAELKRYGRRIENEENHL